MNLTKRKFVDVSFTVVLSALIIWAFWSFFQGSVVFDLFASDAEKFKEYIAQLNSYTASLVYVSLVMIEVLVAFIPGWFIYPVGAAIFGFNKTIFLVLLANLIASSISFWIGRRWGVVLLRKFIAQKYIDQFNAYMEKRGTWAVFFLKLNPVTSFDLWNYVAGASPLKFWKFTVANTLGVAPLILLSAALGEGSYEVAPQLLGVLVLVTVIYLVWSVVNIPHKLSNRKKK